MTEETTNKPRKLSKLELAKAAASGTQSFIDDLPPEEPVATVASTDDSVQVCEPVRNPLAIRLNKIVAESAIHHRRQQTKQANVKVPKEVDDFIDAYSEDHANRSAIYYRMLQLGAQAMVEEMKKGDYFVRLKPIDLPGSKSE